jgi:cyclohexadieny/prephenate dehydrogenase
MSLLYPRVALIGLGLIGGSFSLAAKRAGLIGHVAGHARTAATRETALRLGLADSVHDTAAEAARDADLVLLCVPMGAMEAVAKEIAPVLKPGATVSDVGSVKGAVEQAVAPHIPSCSKTAGASSPRARTPTRRRSRACARSGRAAAPMWTRWIPSTTTSSWR